MSKCPITADLNLRSAQSRTQRDSWALLGNGPSLAGLGSLEHGCPVPGSLRTGGPRLSGCGSSASLPPMNRRSTIPAESVTWKCGGNTTKARQGDTSFTRVSEAWVCGGDIVSDKQSNQTSNNKGQKR